MNALTRYLVIAVAAMTISWLASPSLARAQGEALKTPKRAAAPAATPRTADGKVDFSGIWTPDRKFIYDINDALKKGETLPIQEWALKVTLERLSKDDPEALCLPAGVPRQAPYPWRILQTPTHMFFLFEGNIHSYRQIFMNGKHPDAADLDPTWYGHSIGRFEGDTLVIDTIGFNDKFWFDFAGHPHTEKLHVTERWRLIENGAKIEVLLTIDDPDTFNAPFKALRQYDRVNRTFEEDRCSKNNSINLFDYDTPTAETPDF